MRTLTRGSNERRPRPMRVTMPRRDFLLAKINRSLFSDFPGVVLTPLHPLHLCRPKIWRPLAGMTRKCVLTPLHCAPGFAPGFLRCWIGTI